MPSDIIPSPTEDRKSRRRPWVENQSFIGVVENVLRLLRMAQGALPESRRNTQAKALLGLAADDLETAIEVNATAAAREVREAVLTAMGPGLTSGECAGARKALDLVLSCLDDRPGEPDEGGAA